MRKRIIFLILCFMVLFYSISYAHSPEKIELSYNLETETIRAVITHRTANPRKHYIRKVKALLNDKEIIDCNFTDQHNETTQTVLFLIPQTKGGDTITVEAYCNVSGRLIEKITVKEQK